MVHALQVSAELTHGAWDGGADGRVCFPAREREVPLCGHATLATAFVLFSQRHEMDLIVFETLSGPLRCVRTSDGRIEMDFPSCLLTAVEIDSAAHAEVVRGVVASCQELSHRSIVRVHTGDLGLVIQLQSETELDRLTIDDSVLVSDTQSRREGAS